MEYPIVAARLLTRMGDSYRLAGISTALLGAVLMLTFFSPSWRWAT